MSRALLALFLVVATASSASASPFMEHELTVDLTINGDFDPFTPDNGWGISEQRIDPIPGGTVTYRTNIHLGKHIIRIPFRIWLLIVPTLLLVFVLVAVLGRKKGKG